MKVISFDPYAKDATHDSLDALIADFRRRLPARAGHAGDDRDVRGEAVRRDARGQHLPHAARANLHDQDALVTALKDGPISAAGLDHFPHEYLDPAERARGSCRTSCSPRTSAARPTTPRPTHPDRPSTASRRSCRGERPRRSSTLTFWSELTMPPKSGGTRRKQVFDACKRCCASA